jgi:hypothetical protein
VKTPAVPFGGGTTWTTWSGAAETTFWKSRRERRTVAEVVNLLVTGVMKSHLTKREEMHAAVRKKAG